jgi:hypothetical protein
VEALESCSRDSLEFIKDRAVKSLFELLSSKPEQEVRLLSALVNKLGDPDRKLASKVGGRLGAWVAAWSLAGWLAGWLAGFLAACWLALFTHSSAAGALPNQHLSASSGCRCTLSPSHSASNFCNFHFPHLTGRLPADQAVG